MTAEAVGMLSQELYHKQPSELSEDETATVSAFASLAAGIAGGLVGGDSSSAANAAEAGKTTVENNYLSDSEHRQKTTLELKEKQGKITEVEQQKLAELRIKDVESTQQLLEACSGGTTPACTAARKDALDKIASYVDLTYQNPKTQQAGYQEIDRLLNSTSPEAQQAFDLVEAYTEAFKGHGYSDSEAELYARRYVGSIYLIQGVTGAAISQSLVKQFGVDVAKPNVKPNVSQPKGTTEPEISDPLKQQSVNDTKRPSPRDSEKDVGKDLGEGWREQVSFKDGKEVPYGTKGSVRPDWCQGTVCSVEVKNYTIATNSKGLISNVSKQAIERQQHLPEGMKQEVIIDIRGQKVSDSEKRAVVVGIVQKSNGAIKPTDIQFKGE
ncbi:VENN motif pre-toxin domain-containing protein [Providencia stuartii]|uniref:VENN motif pre-toxin domain-containing protein n=1 Tax=Providencia stuartii TaxID=588 RepID=UPI001F2AB39A|nr:VENN motif pre-toxin domain-containing protein [Providencia stuartii]